MTAELKQLYTDKIKEILDRPLCDAKIQIDYHKDEVPTIRYDVTEFVLPKRAYGEER